MKRYQWKMEDRLEKRTPEPDDLNVQENIEDCRSEQQEQDFDRMESHYD